MSAGIRLVPQRLAAKRRRHWPSGCKPTFPIFGSRTELAACHHLLQSDLDLPEAADLIVAATGSWGAESALNRWHVEQGRLRPILYGWTEAHACAGPCCGHRGRRPAVSNAISAGQERRHSRSWTGRTAGTAARRSRPAAPTTILMVPVELNYVTAMISDVALECLLSPPTRSFSRVFATSQRRVDQLGARWSDEWLTERGSDDPGIRTIDRPWPRTACPACRDQPAEEAA